MNKKPLILADCHIPFLKGSIEQVVDVRYLTSNEFVPSVVRHADGLLIRTRTLCNHVLLENSTVKFIGTATIGYDHIDTTYCNENNITWKNAPGCNAMSVAQYIVCAILFLTQKHQLKLHNLSLGIVGVGNVGSKVAQLAQALGIKVLLNDPPRQENEYLPHFVDINSIASQSDIISFHTPLTHHGKHNTKHLFNKDLIEKLKRKPIIINTARGEIINTDSLLWAIEKEYIRDSIIDCWENEPCINPHLVNKTSIATPHIAGYSTDGKANATRIITNEMIKYFGLDDKKINHFSLPNPIKSIIFANSTSLQDALYEVVTQTYNIEKESDSLKKDLSLFEKIRNEYPIRREFHAYTVKLTEQQKAWTNIYTDLGFNIDPS